MNDNSLYRTIAPAARSTDGAPGSSGKSSGGLLQASSLKLSGQNSDGAPRRRRRVIGKVSQLACVHCRRTRSKCDGERSQDCTRCVNRGLQCVYQPHTKIQKDEILSELASQRGQKESLTKEFRDSSFILDVLTNDGHVDEIIRRLQAKESVHSIATWLLSFPDLQTMEGRNQNFEGNVQDAVERIEHFYVRSDSEDGVDSPCTQWTSVTKNPAFVDHLFRLFFTWVHPHCMLFSETNFLDCYHAGDDTYCSGALVNAICAMACHFLDRSQSESPQLTLDYEALSAAFLMEARSQISPSDAPRITTLQSFAVMFLEELSSGKARVATTYLRCAADNLQDLENDGHKDEVFEASRWGIHTLNTLWSGLTYQKPFNPQSPDTRIPFKFDKYGSRRLYQQYSDDAGQGRTFRAPGFTINTAVHQARLFRIVHGSINLYCGARGKISAKSFIQCHERYVNWKMELPPELICESYNTTIPPNVLTLHIQYYTMLTGQWSPILYFFTGETNTDDRLTEDFRSHLLDHAREGVKLLHVSVRDNLCRYFTPLVTFCILHLCDTVAHWSLDKAEKVSAVLLCCEILDRNRRGFKLCGPLMQMFRAVIDQYSGIDVADELERRYGIRDQHTVEEILDASTRLSYTIPVGQITRWLDPKFHGQWAEEWIEHMGTVKRRRQSNASHPMRLEDVMN